MYGLIIKKKWLDKILSGEKSLEIRGSKTSHIGEIIALIESGTSTIRGFCKIQEVVPLDEEKWNAEKPNHCVENSFSELKDRYKTPYGWYLCEVEPCNMIITYEHPQGAVIWVNLDKVFITCKTDEFINLKPNKMEKIYQVNQLDRIYKDRKRT